MLVYIHYVLMGSSEKELKEKGSETRDHASDAVVTPRAKDVSADQVASIARN